METRKKTYLLTVAFGFFGAVLRYLLEIAFGGIGFPFATLCINLVGCFAIEIVNDFIGRRLHLSVGVVRAMGIGAVGAFTTLSAFTNETVNLLAQGEIALALIYVACTWVGCFLAAYLGHLATGGMAAIRLRRMMRARSNGGMRQSGNRNQNSRQSQDACSGQDARQRQDVCRSKGSRQCRDAYSSQEDGE